MQAHPACAEGLTPTQIAGRLKRIELSDLASKPDLLAHDTALERSGCDYQDEVLDGSRPQLLFDLTPPVAPALNSDDILPERKVLRFEITAEFRRERSAVLAGLG